MSGTSKAPPFKKYKILSHAIHSNRTAADAAADNFSPTSHGLAPEFHKFVHEGYSSIRDGMPVPEPHAKKLLVIGWCGDIQDLVDSLNMFAPGKTVVTVLCDCCPEVSASMGQASNPKTSVTVACDCCPEVSASMGQASNPKTVSLSCVTAAQR